jgi:hypothetical protein
VSFIGAARSWAPNENVPTVNLDSNTPLSPRVETRLGGDVNGMIDGGNSALHVEAIPVAHAETGNDAALVERFEG